MVYDLIVITGAGGVGKTTTANLLRTKLPRANIFDFDEGGVPDIPTVEWRKERTNFWMKKLLKENNSQINFTILSGLCFPSEIRESQYFDESKIIKYFLLTLNYDVLKKRLSETRHWPEFLITGQHNWQTKLISEISVESYYNIIDVENKSVEEILNIILCSLSI